MCEKKERERGRERERERGRRERGEHSYSLFFLFHKQLIKLHIAKVLCGKGTVVEVSKNRNGGLFAHSMGAENVPLK